MGEDDKLAKTRKNHPEAVVFMINLQKSGWSPTQRFSSLCFPNAGSKGVCHHPVLK